MPTVTAQIQHQLTLLDEAMSCVQKDFPETLERVHPQNKKSALNFLKYLIFRKNDVRKLQDQLHANGLSSLASGESHIHRQIQVTLQHLGDQFAKLDSCTSTFGRKEIEKSSIKLFGERHAEWPSSVMVTFDASFLEEKKLIAELLKSGMGVARINCAHDDEGIWLKMIEKIQAASKQTGIPCKIHLDLAGPKIRTVLLGKGNKKGKVKIEVGSLMWLSDSVDGFKEEDVVISPNEPGIISSLKLGDRVFIDDGMIYGKVDELRSGSVSVRIERISSKKPVIKAGKGLNFPDSTLNILSLTDFDRACLPFVCAYADTVGLSFVRKSQDVVDLRDAMREIKTTIPPVILKIETHEAVVNFPELILEGMTEPDFGVMIARGDLAVEIGFERLVEIQEEISWLCEAAHVPVIWATQVLESLHKFGLASRAEITDAGRAAAAECIMINKGPHTLELLRTLQSIATRIAGIRTKNRLSLRPLKIAADFLGK
ncbi:pyruvate kinase [Algoriphagus terrigena]|uniref:pyruvate kinase n=1 Tax=Algoriphagus terrigena TaxID=344884 RepID=UPI000427B5BD|nr:pyruvate kinase [Algoriphagus terrigena]